MVFVLVIFIAMLLIIIAYMAPFDPRTRMLGIVLILIFVILLVVYFYYGAPVHPHRYF